MSRPLITWLLYASFGAAVLAPMVWLSGTALELEAERKAGRRSDWSEETVRLALWRLESALADLVAQETLRPWQHYDGFHHAAEAFDARSGAKLSGGVLLPSPLLAGPTGHVILHFSLDRSGRLTSPQLPVGRLAGLPTPLQPSKAEREQLTAQLAALRATAGLDSLWKKLPTEPADVSAPGSEGPAQRLAQTAEAQVEQAQAARNIKEWHARNQAYNPANRKRQQLMGGKGIASKVARPLRVTEGTALPLWLGDRLFVARRVTLDGNERILGAWLDWEALEPWLCARVADLLPQARLRPLAAGKRPDPERTLSSLPVVLDPGPPEGAPPPSGSTTRLTLIVAWSGALLALVAVGVLLAGTLSLSERRRGFVSAVTHELRTPLTTFRMYSEMLTEGMVPEGARREEYLARIRSEAERLSGLVENVLAYARLESRRTDRRQERIPLEGLVERCLPRLEQRARDAGLELVVEPGDVADAETRVDPAAIEQVLFNLVDNAAKYAGTATDRRLHLQLSVRGGRAELRVRDHGPGISRADARRLFRPFTKAEKHAAGTAPGVGLGLSLSRRLARSQGGDLVIDLEQQQGACLLLSVPLVR